ncbi:MAG: NADP-dependent oxidoreductase [Myxococcota bacterium]
MRAYVLEKSEERPRLSERPDPAPGPGEVLVRTTAVAVHPVDLETAAGGNAMLLPAKRPFVPGVDFVGEVEALGAGVSDLGAGDVVYGYRGIAAQGAFAELLAVPRAELARAPAGHEALELACLPLPGLCALQALDDAGLEGQLRVLVHGGAGGVGLIALQVFARLGHEVLTTASAKDTEGLRALGAAQVIDYRSTRFEEVARAIDLVFDTVGGDTLSRSFAVTRAGGAVVSLRATPPAPALRAAGLKVPAPMAALLPLLSWRARRRARAAGVRLVPQVTVASGARLGTLSELGAQRPFETVRDTAFPFDRLSAAMDRAASGEARGRVVLTAP